MAWSWVMTKRLSNTRQESFIAEKGWKSELVLEWGNWYSERGGFGLKEPPFCSLNNRCALAREN